jgi:hypothetical protein
MYQQKTEFSLKRENFQAAMKTLKELDQESLEGYQSLSEVLREYGWSAHINQAGDISDIEFLQESSSVADSLFEALAPYVEEGSYICMIGEDDESWRWYFTGKRLRTDQGVIRYVVDDPLD